MIPGSIRTAVEPPDRVPFFQVCVAVSPELMKYLKENDDAVRELADQIAREIKKEVSRL